MIYVINPIGFCFGVSNSINQVLKYKNENKDKDVSFLRMIVHDKNTFDQILNKVNGTLYSSSKEYDYLSTVFVSSAHGVILKEKEKINSKKGIFLDTTCPILLKTKEKIRKYQSQGYKIIFFGKENHDETISFLSEFKDLVFIPTSSIDTYDYSTLKDEYYIVSQSTISINLYNDFINKIKENNVNYIYIESICKQCLLRWNKATLLNVNQDSCFIVLGSKSSSNAKEFYNLILNKYPLNKVFFIQDILTLQQNYNKINNFKDVYIMSATSFSNFDVDIILNKLSNYLNQEIKYL